jgi:hypothetical protein
MMNRPWAILCLVLVILTSLPNLRGQTASATINGQITDPHGSVEPGTEVQAVNIDTNVVYPTKTNDSGIYVIAAVPAGRYRLVVRRDGFKVINKTTLVLHVQDILEQNFALEVGSTSESVTVSGDTINMNTSDASVSTVIDHKFVESLPLNGRSFNALLELTPGVVIAPSGENNQGQFSISGQRTTANNFEVDGVSANFGAAPTLGQGTAGTGSAQAFSVLGGTSSLISVEALQEFRISTSSFAPEYGRSPGGQVMLTTRSGANTLHGGAYEYFRNNVLDANDWFANRANLSRAAERHNDFGGFIGGPIQKDKTFYFLSYEGARLRQPNTAVVEVPSEYAREIAPSQIADFLDAYPQPSDHTVISGVYISPLTGSFSNPSTLDAGSIRIDRTFGEHWTVFGRYNDAPSQTTQRTQSLNELDTSVVGTKTLTLNATFVPASSISNTVRGNYSVQNASFISNLDSFDGAVPPSFSILAPGLANVADANIAFYTFDTGIYITGPDSVNRSTQLNFADDLAITRDTHQLKFGMDYRALYLDVRPNVSSLTYEALSVPTFIATGQAQYLIGSTGRASYFLSQSNSLYGQDDWRVRPRLTLMYGLRWELIPAPSARAGTTLAAWTNLNNPSAIALAPVGTQLWSTTYTNFAPRVGVAYKITQKGDLVLRAGGGVFYDLASDSVANLAEYFPNNASSFYLNVALPATNAPQYLPQISLQPPYPSPSMGYSSNLKLPRSYQWNLAIEKSFGGGQALSISYVGQAGRDMLRQEAIYQPNPNFEGAFLLTQNNAYSNYHSLQLQYRRAMTKGLQALANYTWSHALDNSSNDVFEEVSSAVVSAAKDYASSDFDVRQSFSAGLTYSVPSFTSIRPVSLLTRDWSVDALAVARSGFPYNATVLTATIGGAYPRPNLVVGQPIYLYGPQCQSEYTEQCAGRKALNPAAFSLPLVGQQGTEGRNDIPGFNLTQIDLSLGRKFSFTEKLNLLFRADAFNFLNHPNFTNPLAYYLGPSTTAYLQSTEMLNHGLGGLNSLFQSGGPRSLQLSLKLSF